MLHRANGAPLDTRFQAGGLGAADPFAAGRSLAWSGPDAMAAGTVALSGTVESASFPHVETLVVLAGSLRLVVAEQPALDLGVGAAAVIARGTALRVEAAPGTRFAFCTAQGETTAKPGVHLLAADAPLSPSAAPAAEVLIGPTPACRSFNAFTDEAARYRAGTWDSTPYRRISRPHRVNELMHIIAGSVDLTGADGSVTRASAGDCVFVPHGVPCAWDSQVHVAKFYVVQEVAG